jgi:hypothetical protein
MIGFISKTRTALALGLLNIARATWYRLGLKLGFNPVRRLQAVAPHGPFFRMPTLGGRPVPPVSGWQTSALLFSYWPYGVTSQAPDWLANPLTGERMAAPERVWWQIPDFDPEVGDIKVIWELSRMDWVVAFAQHARNGDSAALTRLNDWLSDWCMRNPPYCGPNWKCGQEASIRVMHLAMAAQILGQAHQIMPGLRDLVHLHLKRIAPTIKYAMAQDNNHGTSEAAALFIGGSWLASIGQADGERWEQAGRRWLENRAVRLIGVDGGFSQYSLNYHRMMLDTFCIAEVWRRHIVRPAFSKRFDVRARAATQWLYRMVSPVNGEGPNVGANDGARLLQLTDSAYRDYRPSMQLAMALFADQRAYSAEGPWNHPLQWLDVQMPQVPAPQPVSKVADDGGFAVLRRGNAMAMLRYPRFRFRPSQADALHLDLWQEGDNLLSDAGSYSYNTEEQWLIYFGGTASHNTVQFDDRDQMPRLSRFLFGDWLKTSDIEPLTQDAKGTHFSARYCDSHRACHRRRISLGESHLTVVDEVAGFARKAVLRWRLAAGDWRLDGLRLTNISGDGAHVLTVKANMPVVRCELIQGWASLHYLEKTPVPVLEIEIQQPGTLTTEYHWPA